MTRSSIFLIGGIGVIIYALHKSRRSQVQKRTRNESAEQAEARAQWEGEGGSPAPLTTSATVSG
jgi:hypothetical protein